MIRVLPTMPVFRFCHTCSRCGSHAVSLDSQVYRDANCEKLCADCAILHTQRKRPVVFVRIVHASGEEEVRRV